jgi:ROK family protein
MGWSIMSGWEDFDIRGHLTKSWPVPILIDNDVNLLTLAEHRRFWSNQRHLLYVKAGTGIGSGMISTGSSTVARREPPATSPRAHRRLRRSDLPRRQPRLPRSTCWRMDPRSRPSRGGETRQPRRTRRRRTHPPQRQPRPHAAARQRSHHRGKRSRSRTSKLKPDIIVLGANSARPATTSSQACGKSSTNVSGSRTPRLPLTSQR